MDWVERDFLSMDLDGWSLDYFSFSPSSDTCNLNVIGAASFGVGWLVDGLCGVTHFLDCAVVLG